ncbi:MAG TPA: tRNA epoxyqueuosine(34) reductase QueG [Caulobacteraceae bacterium]
MTTSISERPRQAITERARTLGFEVCRFAGVEAPWPASDRLARFIAAGRHGQMAWMETTQARRSHPRKLWPQARSAVVLGLNYGPDHDPRETLGLRTRGAISVYAQGRDYHQLIKGRLKTLASFMVSRLGGEAKVFVDTAPLMEKPLAAMAGVGWQGKHTNLVSPDFGSWLFLGSVLTTLDLEADAPGEDRCGSCRACLDICPTGAFPAPYHLDARKCISYLTIEHAGPIPVEFRAAMGNRIYGCDDCLAVCPWNKFARVAGEAKLHARDAARSQALADLAALNDAAFRTLFSASPIKRIGRDRFVRNVLYAIGNSGDPRLAAAAAPLLADPCETVRDAARWALEQIGRPAPLPPPRLQRGGPPSPLRGAGV